MQQLIISDKQGGLVTLNIWQTKKLAPGESLWVWDKNSLILGRDMYRQWDAIAGDNVAQRKFLKQCRRVIYASLPADRQALIAN